MSGTRRPTAQDVADLARVSRSAVSLVLNGRAAGMVAAAKQDAVIEAARQLDYRPNAVALSLRSRRSWTIGALTWRGAAGFADYLLADAGQIIRAAGYVPILISVPGGQDELDQPLATLVDRQIDGLVVVAPELDRIRLPELAAGVTTIMINCLDAAGRSTSIVPDELGAGAGAAQILIDHGHTRFAVLGDDCDTLQAEQRLAGARQAAQAAGLPEPLALVGCPTIRQGHLMACQLLAGEDPPTALLCTRERLALGALLGARDLDRQVPEDLSLISLDDAADLTNDVTPLIATVRRPDRAMAEQAVAVLLHEITAPGHHEPKQLTFACSPDLGGSVRAL